MPTAVTGNPIGVAAPAVQPGPDTLVVVNEPIAFEGDTVVSVNQAFTALANEQAWEKKPTAGIPATPGLLDAAFVQPIKAFRNALGQRRDFFDHRGFGNMARITRWQEDWNDKAFAILTGAISADTPWAKRWLATQALGGGSPTAQLFQLQGGQQFPFGVSTPVYVDGSLVMDTGNVTTSPAGLQLVEAAGGTLVTEDTDMAMQVDVIGTGGGSVSEGAFGLSPGISGATGTLASTSPNAVAVIYSSAHTNLQLYVSGGGNPPHALVDLGSASLTATRWRIEIVGVNTSDDSTARVLVYGDGAILANLAYDLAPTNPTNRVSWAPFFRLRNGGGRVIARYGVVDYAAVRFPGNIAY